MPIRTILVPTDFSSCASAALDQALELARTLSARIVLLHSYWVNLAAGPSLYGMVPVEFIDQLHDAANTRLEDWAKRVSQAGVACERRLSAEAAGPAIVDAASALPADLIVMGTHGHTGLKHVLLGSVAERVVRLAACPVLTVKAKYE